MQRNILVLGGTRFFGIRLVQKLIENGDLVTVASRSYSKTHFSPEVKKVHINRDQENSLTLCCEGGPYDVVYDQICYSPDEANLFLKCLGQVTKKFIHTSTLSVYPNQGLQNEADFDPFHYPVRTGDRTLFTYAEGKRLAEAVYFQSAQMPVTAVRFPVVLGSDDYTGRLDFHIKRIAEGLPIAAQNPEAKASLIHSQEAADFLFWIGQQQFNGPINACADGEISLSKIISFIENTLIKKANLKQKGESNETSPFSQIDSWHLDNTKAKALGFQFSNLHSWLPSLIQSQASHILQKI